MQIETTKPATDADKGTDEEEARNINEILGQCMNIIQEFTLTEVTWGL